MKKKDNGLERKVADLEGKIYNLQKESEKNTTFEKINKIASLVISVIALLVSIHACRNTSDTFKLDKSNQAAVMKEDIYLQKDTSADNKYNIQLSVEQGQIMVAYTAMFDSRNKNDPFISRVYPSYSEKNKEYEINIPVEIIDEKIEGKVDENYLYKDKTNHMELICLDSQGNKQKYCILIVPRYVEERANKTGISHKTGKIVEQSQATIQYELRDKIMFDCNLINKKTIEDKISTYRQTTEGNYENISSQDIYDNIMNVNKLVKQLL